MRCDVAYSCGSIIAAPHAVINDSRCRRAAAQPGAEGAPERAESLGGKSRPVGMKTQKLEGRSEEAEWKCGTSTGSRLQPNISQRM